MNTTTTTDFAVSYPLSKKEILFRLFNAGHITFDELWVLAQDTIVNNYISQPAPYPVYPSIPVYPYPITPMYMTTSTPLPATNQVNHESNN